ncbi:MAG TPA: carbamate kinase [Candidatus Limnocylindrales bacterium]|nr:carbamate kinase [Candidatus Limnocylindrales bacterium]
MRVVVALGGNALLQRGQPLEASIQQANVARAARAIVQLAASDEVVVTHGNGPQVGLLALQSEAYSAVHPYPLDVLGAESEGMIGYLLAQGLHNAGLERQAVSVLTRVQVDAQDPAFTYPTKPVGPLFTRVEADRLAVERRWTIAPDGPGYRRVVPSPDPLAIVEIQAIRVLVAAGFLVICTGGGGIPTAVASDGVDRGVEAVVDKDLAAALLARDLEADALLMLTDVPAVMAGWDTPEATPIRRVRVPALRQRRFAPGSMGPKVEAACRFVEATGGIAGIGSLDDGARILTGEAGTMILPDVAATRMATG